MSHDQMGVVVKEDEDDSLRKDAFVFASAMAGAETLEQSMPSPSHREDEFSDLEGLSNQSFEMELQRPRTKSSVITPPSRGYAKPSPLKEKDRSGSSGIPHVYHDYSQVPDVVDFARKKTGGVTQPFPEKLHEMLNAVEGTSECHIVSWLSHGRAFIVHKPREFTERIMPRHFKQTKLTSFQRQLNLYGFRRLTQGPDAGAYYHERFLRARPVLCQHMARQKVKGTGHKQPADAKTEPNFYSMRPVEPAPPAIHTSTEDEVHEEAMDSFDTTNEFSYSNYDGGYAEMNNANHVTMDATMNSYSRLPPVSFDSLSPASPGMTGAAHLLTGISQGYMGNLSIPMDTNGRTGTSERDQSGSDSRQFLQPRLTAPSSTMRRTTEHPSQEQV